MGRLLQAHAGARPVEDEVVREPDEDGEADALKEAQLPPHPHHWRGIRSGPHPPPPHPRPPPQPWFDRGRGQSGFQCLKAKILRINKRRAWESAFQNAPNISYFDIEKCSWGDIFGRGLRVYEYKGVRV